MLDVLLIHPHWYDWLWLGPTLIVLAALAAAAGAAAIASVGMAVHGLLVLVTTPIDWLIDRVRGPR